MVWLWWCDVVWCGDGCVMWCGVVMGVWCGNSDGSGGDGGGVV